jgi:hypothetical protein
MASAFLGQYRLFTGALGPSDHSVGGERTQVAAGWDCENTVADVRIPTQRIPFRLYDNGTVKQVGGFHGGLEIETAGARKGRIADQPSICCTGRNDTTLNNAKRGEIAICGISVKAGLGSYKKAAAYMAVALSLLESVSNEGVTELALWIAFPPCTTRFCAPAFVNPIKRQALRNRQ